MVAWLLLGGDALAHSISGEDTVPVPPTAAAPLADAANASSPPAPDFASLPGEHESSHQWLSQVPLLLPAIPSLDEDEFTHPGVMASRMPLRRPGRQVAPGPAAIPGGSSIAAPAGLVPAEEDILATLDSLQHAVAELVVEGTDARVGPGGQVRFSLAGIEGFHYSARDGQTSIGHGDLALTIGDPTGAPRQPVAGAPAAYAIPASQHAGPPLHVIELLREVLAYPLVWVLAFLLLVGKIALLVASRRARKHRHRRRPQSRQQEALQKAPQKVRKRVRIRIRQRQPVIGVQQPR